MTSFLGILNRLLPFATPGTPLLQDLVHLGVICALLYFAPQIQDWIQRRNTADHQEQTPVQHAEVAPEDDQHDPPDHEAQQAGNGDQRGFEEEVDRQDEGPDNEDFREFQQQQQQQQQQEGGDEAGPENAPGQRNVGAKKARSLARRDQRRAYHEFQRAQGEAQRARDAEGAAEREAAQAAERERRQAAEAKLEAKKAKEREVKRERERREREEEIARRETAVAIVRRELEEQRMSNLFEVARSVGGDADDVWVEKMLNASGVLGRGADGAFTMVTSTGWVVKVTKEDMQRVYKKAAEKGLGDGNGKIGFEELSGLLQDVLRGHS
ncbi:Hypothetical predicted protein [Lecanosticta acicola]|uniref:EF-hand domain-containing protein n=1 Tax=Lecanosticta acicola TaxID=111012 RepID=A0AAI8YTQ2_9PEZI|nr:Hypothetical predicted protein [Lecanosticta acicola]